MQFDVEEVTPHARATVFAAHRDDLEHIVRFLPEVVRVEATSRVRHANGVEEQVHVWTGSSAALPLPLRPFVPAAMLVWTQTTTWDPTRYEARWTVSVPSLGEAVRISGSNRYFEDGPESCRVVVTGTFELRPSAVPALDGRLPQAAIPMIEKVVVGLILPLVRRTGEAVRKHLDGR